MRNMKILVVAVILAGCCIVALGSAVTYAFAGPVAGSEMKGKTVENAGNTICPVSGQKVDGQNYFVYEGKGYGLCCPMCAAEFKKNPKKYSAIAEKEITNKK